MVENLGAVMKSFQGGPEGTKLRHIPGPSGLIRFLCAHFSYLNFFLAIVRTVNDGAAGPSHLSLISNYSAPEVRGGFEFHIFLMTSLLSQPLAVSVFCLFSSLATKCNFTANEP